MREHRGRISAIAALLTIACSSTPSARSPAATFRIGPAGVDPHEVRVKRGNYVMFVNNDNRPHTMVSDPVDLHTQCPVLNRVGIISRGRAGKAAA
jgi:plastocyanin